jgi:hypothetical protein
MYILKKITNYQTYIRNYILKHIYIRTDVFKYVPITTIPFCTYDTYLCT